MVTINGIATRRVSSPASSIAPPTSSADMARKTITSGNGIPRLDPNQLTWLSK